MVELINTNLIKRCFASGVFWWRLVNQNIAQLFRTQLQRYLSIQKLFFTITQIEILFEINDGSAFIVPDNVVTSGKPE